MANVTGRRERELLRKTFQKIGDEMFSGLGNQMDEEQNFSHNLRIKLPEYSY